MADQPISQLPVAGTLSGNEVTVVVQGGVTKQVQVSAIANAISPGKLITSVSLTTGYYLIFFYSDGSTSTAGPIPGYVSATINGSGHLILTSTTGATTDCGNVVGPQGPTGPTGPTGTAATIAAGTATTLPYGSTPTVTNTGSSSAATFNFGIPAGAPGATGPFSAGATGLTPNTPTSGAVVLGGTLNVASGGTGAVTLTGYVKGNGTSAMTASATVPTTDLSGTVTNAQLANSAITINGTSTSLGGSVNVGTVTSVTGTSPVVSSGGATPAISMPAATTSVSGYLTSTDWNTFNSKGSGSVTSVALTAPSIFTVTGSPITSSGTLALTYSGTALPILNGGTGASTANDGFNALAPSQTGNSGKYLTTDGSNTSWATNPLGTVTSITAGTGLTGGTITTSGTIAIDTTVVATLTGTQTLTNKTISGASNTLSNIGNASLTNSAITINGTSTSLGGSISVGTVTSVNLTASTGISVSGGPITGSGSITVTNTAPDQTVAIASGTGISVTGTYPNFTVTNTSPSSGGTVTSVTTSLPLASSGGTTPNISIPAATTSVSGYLTSTDWNTFNGKQPAGTYVNSVSGTTGRITSTGGVTPVIDLASGIATAGTTGSATLIPVVTIDTYGRVTSITTAANPQGTVTSVNGTGTVSGISLSGTVTSTGNLTLGGTLDLSSPPAIGGTTANLITGTTITATKYVGVSGGTF